MYRLRNRNLIGTKVTLKVALKNIIVMYAKYNGMSICLFKQILFETSKVCNLVFILFAAIKNFFT